MVCLNLEAKREHPKKMNNLKPNPLLINPLKKEGVDFTNRNLTLITIGA